MLQNRTYLGYVKYQPYKRNLDGSRSYAGEVQWFKGKHDAVIPQELFDRCQEVRAQRGATREYVPKHHVFLLNGIIFCAECVENMPENAKNNDFGKMRAQSNTYGKNLYYRCRAHDFGRECSQTSVKADIIEEQVIYLLKTLKPPTEWQARMVASMGDLLGDKQLEERIAEIKEIIERMDFRWDQGFITDKNDYLEKRVKLQQELEQLTPIPDDELETAADMLANFSTYWTTCEGDTEKQHELVKLIVERVYVQDEYVVALTLKANYHFVLGKNAKGPTTVSVDPSVYTFGSDGYGTRSGYAILIQRENYSPAIQQLIQRISA